MFKVHAENFLSYDLLDFDFRNRGLVSITGSNEDEPMFASNGAGKTSLLESLSWGIYGKCTKGDTADSVINNKVGKDCLVEVEWGQFKINRYRKHSKFKDDLQLYIDGIEQTGKSNKETQERIEKEIGLNHSSFIYSIYFAQNNLNNFADAGDAKQKDIIENILGLNTITDAQDWCKDQIKTLNGTLSTKQTELSNKEVSLNQINLRINSLEESFKKFDYNRELEKKNVYDNISILEKRKVLEPMIDIDEAHQLISIANSVKDEYESIGQQKNIIDIEIKNLNQILLQKVNERNKERLEHQSKVNKQKLEYQKLISDINSSIQNLQNKRKSIANEIIRIQKDIDHYSKAEEKTCITCFQKITDEQSKTKLYKLLEEKQLKDAEEVEVRVEIEEAKRLIIPEPNYPVLSPPTEVDSTTPLIKAKENEKIELDEKAKKLKSIVDTASKLAIKIEQEKNRISENNATDRMIEVWADKIGEIENRENPYQLQIDKETIFKNNLQNEIKDLNKEKKDIEFNIIHYSYWVDGFSNKKLKSYIMESITPFLNDRANFYSKFLTGGSFIIDISTQTRMKNGDVKEKFNVGIESRSMAGYSSSSGGERRRIDLCILLALQDLVASRATMPLNVLILDECTENLDAIGVERMIEMLQVIAQEKDSVFFITHDETLKNYFPNQISITKRNGYSTINDV